MDLTGARACADAQGGVVSAAQLEALGIGRKRVHEELRAGRWARMGKGWVIPYPAAHLPLHLRITAAQHIARGAPAWRSTAALVHGWIDERGLPGYRGCADLGAALRFAVPLETRRSPAACIKLARVPIHEGEAERVDGVLATTPLRTAVDVARFEPRPLALALADSALRSGALTRAQLVEAVAALPPRHRGVAQARCVAGAADALSESPLESVSRLAFIDHGLLPDALQLVICDATGQQVARADFAWRGSRRTVLGEADGAEWHGTAERSAYDEARDALLRELGFEVVRWGWPDMQSAPLDVVARVRRALWE